MNRSTRYVAGYVPVFSIMTSVASVHAAWMAVFALLSEGRQEGVHRAARSSALRRGWRLGAVLVSISPIHLQFNVLLCRFCQDPRTIHGGVQGCEASWTDARPDVRHRVVGKGLRRDNRLEREKHEPCLVHASKRSECHSGSLSTELHSLQMSLSFQSQENEWMYTAPE